jgi:plasmid stabilization system protein ParE
LPQVIITEVAAKGMERCRKFLKEKNPMASKHAGQIIFQNFTLLKTNPEIGRPVGKNSELRELVIDFGESGYVALYRIELNAIYILAFRHQKEVGYHQ